MKWLVIVAVCVAVLSMIMLLRRPRGSIVIGSELASASAAESRRLARNDLGPSPMPPGTYSSAEAGLNAVVESPLDDALRKVVRQYAASAGAVRSAMRDATSMDEGYTLLTFASREVVFAMRGKDAVHVDDALSALAMLDLERIDWRDGVRVIDLVHHAAARFDGKARRLERAASLASSRVADLLRERAERPAPALEECLYTEIPTGLIDRGIEAYAPARDLVPPLLAIAELFRKEETDVRVSIAQDLPAYWVGDDQSLVASASGTATINTGFSEEQSLIVFLSEVADAENANAIVKAARSAPRRNWALVALARENLVCLVVARAFVAGVPNAETDETLSRFEKPIAAILDGAA